MTAKNYQKAVDCYSKAIEIDGSNPIYYGNRYRLLFNYIDLLPTLLLERLLNL